MIQLTWKQGQTVGVSVFLDEELNGRVLYLGLYQYSIKNINRNAILMLSTDNGLTQIGTMAYSAKITNTVTKNLEVGSYRLEALLRDKSNNLTAIGTEDIFVRVVQSNIGKEV